MFTSEFNNFWSWLIGHKTKPSSKESNYQRYFSRFCIFLCILLLLEASLSAYGVLNNEISLTAAIALSIVSITLFYWVILVPPFTHGKKTNALRLLGNTIISSVLMIGIFAIWYRKFGIQPEYTALDAWYFSTVTFSTLGFGDFTPKPYSQIFAAIQAVLGNLHLGFIVGSTLFATSQ